MKAPSQPHAHVRSELEQGLSHPGRIEVANRIRGTTKLTPAQRATARALAQALFSTERGAPDAARLDWLCDELDDFFRHAGERAKLGFALCLLGIAIVAPLLILRLRPFRTLDMAQRTEALERLESSPIALALFGAKAVLCIVWYEHPASRAEIGHDGACLGRATRLEVLP